MERKPLAFVLVYCAVLCGASPQLTSARDYDFPELGASLSLSSAWIPISPSLVAAYNEDLVRQNPKTQVRYVAGFTRGKPSDGSDTGPDFIWIQSTPMPDPPFTPEQFVAALPGVISEKKDEIQTSKEGRLSSIDPGTPRYDARVGAIICDLSATFRDGGAGRAMAFLIATKKFMISINAYSTPANADVVFEQARGIVSTLELKKEQTMPATWTDRLRQLLIRR